MKTKTIELYEYSELSQKSKDKARAVWNETNDDPFMQSHMINVLKEKLDERGIKYDTDSIDVRYSLSSCQGDGFMFEGIFSFPTETEKEGGQWKRYEVRVKHSGRYYHSNSKTVEVEHDNETVEKEFEVVYQEICKEMERIGYDEIEYQQSEENFEQACEVNEWTFRKDGTMENEEVDIKNIPY